MEIDEREEVERPCTDVVVSRDLDLTLTDLKSVFDAKMLLDTRKRQLKMIERLVDDAGKKLMQAAGCHTFSGGGGMEMWLKTEKKDVFENEKIYDFFSIPLEFQAVLPKNPAFKKTELKKAFGDDYKDIAKSVDKIDLKLGEIKEPKLSLVDTTFIK